MEMIEEYLAPQTLEEVLHIAARPEAVILAGGTDLHPRWSKCAPEGPRTLLDIKGVSQFHGITRTNGEIRVGACTLMSELDSDPLILEGAPLLAAAAGRIACPQIRNRATVGGNLCNASPAADTAIPLILLDAVLDLASVCQGKTTVRETPVADFFGGPGSTKAESREVLLCVRFGPQPTNWFSAWEKFGTRPAMEIAVASVGVVLGFERGVVAHAGIGYGSVAPVPRRGRKAEAELVGQPISDSVIDKCVSAACEEIEPISDVRASANYRRHIVGVLLRRMLQNARNSRQA